MSTTTKNRTKTTRCAECGMDCPDGPFYHPHLHCVIWKTYRRDPSTVLAEHGYQRT